MDFLYPTRGEGLGCYSAPPPYSMGDLHPVEERAMISRNFLARPPPLHSPSRLLLADGFSKCFFFLLQAYSSAVPISFFLFFWVCVCGWQRTCILDAPSLSHSVEHSLTPSPFGVAWFSVALGLHAPALLGSPILLGIGLPPLNQSCPTPVLFGLVLPQLSLCNVSSTVVATPTALGR